METGTQVLMAGEERDSTKKFLDMLDNIKSLTKSLMLHVVDPAEFSGVHGVIEFSEPAPLRDTVFMNPNSGALVTVVDSEKLFLDKITFYKKLSQAMIRVCSPTGHCTKYVVQYSSSVEGLALLFHDGVYSSYRAGRATISSQELAELLSFLDVFVRDIDRNLDETYRQISAQKMFREYHEQTRSGNDLIFSTGWSSLEIVTDWYYPNVARHLLRSQRSETLEFIGIKATKWKTSISLYDKYINSRISIDVSVDVNKEVEAKYRLSPLFLGKLPVTDTLVRAYTRGRKVLDDYLELAKRVFLAVKAYVT